MPILDGIAERTGWKLSLVAGGPEPANMGRLNVLRSELMFSSLLSSLTDVEITPTAYILERRLEM